MQQQRLAASYVAALALYDAANDEASRFDSDLFVEYDVLGARDDEDMRADLRAVAAGATRPAARGAHGGGSGTRPAKCRTAYLPHPVHAYL